MNPTYNTGKLQIGRCYIRPAMRVEGDALPLQAALLEKRSAKPLSLLMRVLGSVWRWL